MDKRLNTKKIPVLCLFGQEVKMLTVNEINRGVKFSGRIIQPGEEY
ncbi:MAG: hypothetical protein E6507_08165 [Prevotella bivia]|nr:hypothetical protein [Prevotella bivia]